MKRVLYASVIALGCTIAVAAQGGAADQSKDKGGKKDATEKAVTLTGCVAESGGHFMLNNATMEGGGAPATYALSGGTLKPHVGHKVTVTGAMKPPAASKDSMKKDSMAKTDAKKDDMASAGTVSVKELKMVAPSCS